MTCPEWQRLSVVLHGKGEERRDVGLHCGGDALNGNALNGNEPLRNCSDVHYMETKRHWKVLRGYGKEVQAMTAKEQQGEYRSVEQRNG